MAVQASHLHNDVVLRFVQRIARGLLAADLGDEKPVALEGQCRGARTRGFMLDDNATVRFTENYTLETYPSTDLAQHHPVGITVIHARKFKGFLRWSRR